MLRIRSQFYILGLTALVWLFGLPVVAQQPYDKITLPPLQFTPPQVERHVLPNGLKVFFVEDHELPVVSMYALIKTGQIYEPADKIGLASLMAEVMRTGGTTTRTPDELNTELEYLASSVEASMEEESGSVELWTLKKNLDASLAIFAEVLRHPAFDDTKFKVAKTQMFEMLRRRSDSPQDIRTREVKRLMYGPAHPLARIPQIATIDAITRADVVAFHQQYVQPNNLMLAVTGDFDPPTMLAKLHAIFADWPTADVVFPPVATVTYELTPAVYVIHKDVAQTNLAIGHLGVKADNPDYPALRVVDLILGAGGFSSRLFQKVRTERGLTYSVGSYLGGGTRDYGAFLIFCDTRNETVQETIRLILDEVRALTTTDVSAREIEAAKNQYLNSYVFKFATVNDVIRRNMFYEYIGYPPDFLEQFRERVMQVTAADVKRVAQQYLHPDQMIILAVGDQDALIDQLAPFGDVQEWVLDPVEE